MSKPRYILQKAFPNAPKGTIISWNPGYCQYMGGEWKHNHNECVFFTQEEIDRNPTWFLPEQPEPESKGKDVFTWTDELVKEFCEWDKTRIHTSADPLYLFKQSKQLLKPDTEDGKGRGKEFGTPFERLVYWATHSGWRYCQGRKECGNEPILKLSHFEQMVDHIEKETNPKPDTKEAIKSAIEVLVNNGYEVVKVDSANNSQHTYHPYRYTQQQLDEAIEKAFEESRMYDTDKYSGDINDYRFVFKFRTFQDYINSINTNTKTSKHWT